MARSIRDNINIGNTLILKSVCFLFCLVVTLEGAHDFRGWLYCDTSIIQM